MSNAMNQFFINLPPEKAGNYIVQNTAAGVAATAFDWTAAIGAPLGKVWLTLEALSQDVYVRFGPTSTTATTASNGRLIKSGAPGIGFYVHPINHKFLDLIAAGAGGTLKIQVSSPIGERVAI